MKKNKLLFLAIFTLVFLGFTSNVKAGCCYQTSDTKKWTYVDSIPSSTCQTLSGTESLTKDACEAKNQEGYFCCEISTGKHGTQSQTSCPSPNYSWTDERGCEEAYDRQYHQCCSNDGTITEASTKSNCEITANVSRGYRWRTVYECAALKKVCCDQGKENPNLKTEAECAAYATQKHVAAIWRDKASCAGITESSSRDTVNHIDLTNPLVTPNPPTNPNQQTQDRTGTDQDYGNGGSPTDPFPYMKVDLGCDGMKDVLRLVKTIYNLIRYATPLVLIILGSVDFMKAVMAGKEDEIKKNQHRFVSRLGLAVGVFLLLSVFQLITNILSSAGTEDSDAWYNCWNSLMIMFK